MNAAQEQLVAAIVGQLEAGTAPWVRPWTTTGSGMPANLVTDRAYNGVNVLQLWMRQSVSGYPTADWCTFIQARASGATVRKGEHGTPVWFVQPSTAKPSAKAADDTDDAREFRGPVLRQFTVFNRAQLDGLPPVEQPVLIEHDPLPEVDALLTRVAATVRIGGDTAYYDRTRDIIACPPANRFVDGASYYATLLHEHAHWTGHESRLARTFGRRFGDNAYAVEELVAELTSAFACAELGVCGQLRHAEYLAGWARVLRAQPAALWPIAAQATRAHAWLRDAAVAA